MAIEKTRATPIPIVAVAIGSPANNQTFHVPGDETPANLARVRPYITGLINELHNRALVAGNDYVIDYREGPEGNLDFSGPPDRVILGLSTTVVSKAPANLKIVGIVSDPVDEGFTSTDYICGFSAQRHQNAGKCFARFFSLVPSLTDVYVVGFKQNHKPSKHARDNIQVVADLCGITLHIPITTNKEEFLHHLHAVPKRLSMTLPTAGIFALPTDISFSMADQIIAAQHCNKNPTFFPTADTKWVQRDLPSMFGGHGFSQEKCGAYLAERVIYAWNTPLPFPLVRWTGPSPQDVEWFVSTMAAADVGIPIGAAPPGHIR